MQQPQLASTPEPLITPPPPPSRRPSPDSDSDDDDDDDDNDNDELPAAASGTSGNPSAASTVGPLTSATRLGRRMRKKRERACDWCRHRKVKCDGASKPGQQCSLCERQNVGCTYVSKSKRRKVPDRGEQSTSAKVTRKSTSLPPPAADSGTRVATAGTEAIADSHMIALGHDEVDPSAGQSPFSPGSSSASSSRRPMSFMGRSSTMSLIVETHALVVKQKPPQPVSTPSETSEKKHVFGQRQPWEVESYIDVLALVDCWPAPDLAAALVETYFRRRNTVVPLLQENEFQSRFASSDYLTDRTFASLCLMVFALAAREHINDPRTWAPSMSLDPYGPATFDRWSAGWHFYHQATRQTRHRTKPADLWDMQLSVLSAEFLGGASANPLVSWTLIGEGLIFAQEIGAHRSGQALSTDPAEEALMRRAFWVLFCLDAVISTQIGRSYHIATSTVNAPLPEDTSGVPANETSMEAFRLLIDVAKLLKTAGDSLYSLDSASRSRSWLLLQMKALHVEADALQQRLPLALRWTSSMPDERVFYAATCVQVMLQQLLLLVHRPSLPTRNQAAGPPLSPSSFDSAVSAALRTSYIVQALSKRGNLQLPFVGAAVTEAAATLGLALLGANHAGLVVDEETLAQGLLRCRECVAAGCEVPLAVAWMDDILELKSPAGRPEPPSRLPSAFLLHFGPAGSAPQPLPQPPMPSAPVASAPPDFAFSPFSLEGFAAPSAVSSNPFSLEGLGFGILDPSVGRLS